MGNGRSYQELNVGENSQAELDASARAGFATSDNDPLVDRDRILFPPLHIKLSLMKQFTKALDKDGDCFTYLCQAFPGLTMEKLKAGIFDGPQIWQLIRDPEFENSMNEVELEAWKAFVLVVKKFLGSNKVRN